MTGAGHHQCHQQRGWDIDTFHNFINPGQAGWGEGGIMSSPHAVLSPALPSDGRVAQEPSLSSVRRFPKQPVHLLAGHSSLWPRDSPPPTCQPRMTEGHHSAFGTSACLWPCLKWKRDLAVGAMASEERAGEVLSRIFSKQQHIINIAG